METGKVVVRVDYKYLRPAEVETLLGDATRAKNELGWEPKTSFEAGIDQTVYSYLNQLNALS